MIHAPAPAPHDAQEAGGTPEHSPVRSISPHIAVICALAYLALHAAFPLLFPEHATAFSLIFLTLTPALASAACVRRGRSPDGPEGWSAAALAMAFWSLGMAATMASALLIGPDGEEGAIGMLLFVLYGVPLIFAAASPDNEAWHVRLLDAAMALMLGLLFAAHTLSFSTLTGTAAAGTVNLRLMFDIENLFVGAFALIRFATSGTARQRTFFGVLTLFAFAYMASAGYINHFQSDADYGGMTDLVIDAPFLLLAILALSRLPMRETWLATSQKANNLVRSASPLMLAISLLVVSASLIAGAPMLAIAGFATATLGTGLRNVFVQTESFRMQDRLDELARIDALTGLANRRQFDETLRREWARARRSGDALALVMIDIDHFKLLNDTFGHPVGDERLRAVGKALQGCVRRGGDLIARYGGEEFAAILPATVPNEAQALAEAMRGAVARLNLSSPAGSGILTVSLGIGHIFPADDGAPEALIAMADTALYRAKQEGRDRVVAAAASMLD